MYPKASSGTEQQPFVSSTIRIIHANGKVVILRLEALVNNKSELILQLQDSTKLAIVVRDSLLIHNFHAMLEKNQDYIYFKDRHHVFTAASETLVAITSVNSRDELMGKIDYDVFSRECADQYYQLEKQIFTGQVDVAQQVQPTIDKQGNSARVDNQKYPIKETQENIIGLFGIARIINDCQYKQLKEK